MEVDIMRCFTSTVGGLREGIEVVRDDRLGDVIFLGEEGRGRRWEKVALGKRNPPPVEDCADQWRIHCRRVVCRCQPAVIRGRARREGEEPPRFYILEREHKEDDRFLVRVLTRACYTRASVGHWRVVSGKPETLIEGYGAHGDAGRIGRWYDGLVVMHPGDVLEVTPEGGYKVEPYVLVHQGDRLEQMSVDDWSRLCAVGDESAAQAI